MPHPANADSPHRPGGRNTKTAKRKRALRLDAAEKRARRRYKVVKFVYDQELQGLPHTQVHAHVVEAVDQGDLEIAKAPSYSTVHRWLEKAEELGGPPFEIEDWRDDSRQGRPPKEFDPDLIEALEQEIVIAPHAKIRTLYRTVKRKAKELEVEAPTYGWVKRFRNRVDPAELSAAKHGHRAAIADNVPKLTVPADFPHEVWTLDESLAPVWIRAYHPTAFKHVAVKPYIILVVDNFSRAIVSYRVVPPFRTGTKVAFDSDDILGTLLSAALPELAPPATVRYAGFLPRHLRWDRHSTHRALADSIRGVGVQIPDTPGNQPWSQGRIERLFATTKILCENLRGWEVAYLPASEAKADPVKSRRKAATRSSSREPSRVVIATRDLMSIDQFTEALAERVQEYNRREHTVIRQAPEVAYFNHLDESRLRSGYDALHLLDNHSFTVRRGGLVHRKQRFAWESGGRTLSVGTKVDGKPDPLLRGLYIRLHGSWQFMPREDEHAKHADYKKIVVEQKRAAKDASIRAHEAREQRLEDEVGPGAVEAAREELERTLEGQDEQSSSADEETQAATNEAADEAPAEDEATRDELARRRKRRGLRSAADRIRKVD